MLNETQSKEANDFNFYANVKRYLGVSGVIVKAIMKDGSKKILKSEKDITDSILFIELEAKGD
jgi:hypothetical protein